MKKFLTILAAVFLLSACKSNTLISDPEATNEPTQVEGGSGAAPIINAMPALKPDGTPYDVEEMIVVGQDGALPEGGEATQPNVFVPLNTDSGSAPAQEPAPAPSADSSVKSFEITAKNWEFSPSTITVNQGDTVKLTISSVDVKHGFALPDYNVSVNLFPGSSETVEFVADKVGTFNFYCSVFCGDGHSNMQGQLIVQ